MQIHLLGSAAQHGATGPGLIKKGGGPGRRSATVVEAAYVGRGVLELEERIGVPGAKTIGRPLLDRFLSPNCFFCFVAGGPLKEPPLIIKPS